MASFTSHSEEISKLNTHSNGHTPGAAFDELHSVDLSETEVELGKKKKVPRRIIHFVNGDTLEEYSTDEEEEDKTPPVDTTQLDWLRWFWFYLVLTATKSLGVADFLGEKLAWFFGITTPKYQYIVDEYHKLKEEEEEDERLAREEAEAELAEIETDSAERDFSRQQTNSESAANDQSEPTQGNEPSI